MRALVQRVTSASVRVDGELVAQIGPGLLVLLGVTHDDGEAVADRLADKVRALRVFPDEDGRMIELDLSDAGRAFVEETRRRRDAWFTQQLAALTPEQRDLLEQAAPVLKELADK